VPGFLKARRTAFILSAAAALLALSAVLKILGLLATAAQVTAWATAVLAVGAVAAAAAVAAAYAELGTANQQLAAQLLRGREADLAQVEIERYSGPGELLRVNLRNGSTRAIRNVYVWADVQGVPGHYAAGVPAEDPQSRHMANVPHNEGLYWRLRVIRPGRQAFFTQLVHLNPQPLAAPADATITAFAEFTDSDGTWWRCDEDGNLQRRESAEPAGSGSAVPAQPPALRAPDGRPDDSVPQPRLAGRIAAARPSAARPRHGAVAGRPQPPGSPHYSDVP
jgi:hypothetical protein